MSINTTQIPSPHPFKGRWMEPGRSSPTSSDVQDTMVHSCPTHLGPSPFCQLHSLLTSWHCGAFVALMIRALFYLTSFFRVISSALDVLSIIHRWNALTLLLTVVTSQTLASLVQWLTQLTWVSAQTQAKSKFSPSNHPPVLLSSSVNGSSYPSKLIRLLLPHTVSAPIGLNCHHLQLIATIALTLRRLLLQDSLFSTGTRLTPPVSFPLHSFLML